MTQSKYIVYNQNIFDACIWAYGTINNIVDFVLENDLKFDSTIEQGTEINFDETKGSSVIKNHLLRNNLIPVSFMQEENNNKDALLWTDNINDYFMHTDNSADALNYK